MRRLQALFAVALLSTTAHAAAATVGATTLDRVRERAVVRCGSAIRPGLAFPDADHVWHGLHVDLCRAVAAAVLGDAAKIAFTGYALRPDFDRIRHGDDDVAFLTASEMFAHELFGAVLPGPVVFQETTGVMVWESSPVRHVAELGRTMVCDEPGTAAERNLDLFARENGWTPNLSGWMELEEMMDAYNVGRCPAVAGETTALAALRIGSAHEGHASRILPEPIAITPILVATPAGTPGWASVVAWTMQTVMAGPDAARTLPIAGEWLGLDRAWQSRVTAAGDYATLYQRSLGEESALRLPAGANSPWRGGGLFVPLSIE